MKKNRTYQLLFILPIAIYAALLSGCITEDLSKCPQPVSTLSVIFTDPYKNDDPYQGLNTDEFPNVTLFIYDQSNRLVATESLYECWLDQEYKTTTELPAGSYNLVTWIGTEALYYIFDDVTDLEYASLTLYIPENNTVDYWVSPLYYGTTPFEINSGTQVAVIPIIQYTNDIFFTIEGLDEKDRYTLSVEDNNGKYSFKNTYLPCQYFEYQNEPLFFMDHFQTRITILRLMENREPLLSLVDEVTSEILYPAPGQKDNLVELIEMAYENENFDFDSRHLFNFTLVFDDDMKATIYIDGWEVKENEYEI